METNKKKSFNTTTSIERAKKAKNNSPKWKLVSENIEYTWNTRMDRVRIIRQGVPYGSIEVISKRINVPVKKVLHIFDLPQTTYNKKRKENSMLNGRDSEIVLLLTELIDYGLEVFNNENEKFQRWLKKKNISLGGNTPEDLLDSATGIQEVKNSLNRLEFGNLA